MKIKGLIDIYIIIKFINPSSRCQNIMPTKTYLNCHYCTVSRRKRSLTKKNQNIIKEKKLPT